MMTAGKTYIEKIRRLHQQLGISEARVRLAGLPLQPECLDLCDAGQDIFGRAQLMSRETLDAWQKMQAAAKREHVNLLLVSAFRGADYQHQLIERKLEQGQQLDEILQVNAPPGYSEHHTGSALDLTTDNCPALTEAFDQTPAFRWLTARAAEFGFVMSFPRGNPHGIAYEPWHWAKRGIAGQDKTR